jgi:hypothetical protein
VRLEGLGQLKNPMTSGVEPANFPACSIVPKPKGKGLVIGDFAVSLFANLHYSSKISFFSSTLLALEIPAFDSCSVRAQLYFVMVK